MSLFDILYLSIRFGRFVLHILHATHYFRCLVYLTNSTRFGLGAKTELGKIFYRIFEKLVAVECEPNGGNKLSCACVCVSVCVWNMRHSSQQFNASNKYNCVAAATSCNLIINDQFNDWYFLCVLAIGSNRIGRWSLVPNVAQKLFSARLNAVCVVWGVCALVHLYSRSRTISYLG